MLSFSKILRAGQKWKQVGGNFIDGGRKTKLTASMSQSHRDKLWIFAGSNAQAASLEAEERFLIAVNSSWKSAQHLRCHQAQKQVSFLLAQSLHRLQLRTLWTSPTQKPHPRQIIRLQTAPRRKAQGIPAEIEVAQDVDSIEPLEPSRGGVVAA